MIVINIEHFQKKRETRIHLKGKTYDKFCSCIQIFKEAKKNKIAKETEKNHTHKQLLTHSRKCPRKWREKEKPTSTEHFTNNDKNQIQAKLWLSRVMAFNSRVVIKEFIKKIIIFKWNERNPTTLIFIVDWFVINLGKLQEEYK